MLYDIPILIIAAILFFVSGFFLGGVFWKKRPKVDGYLDVIQTDEGAALMLEIESFEVTNQKYVTLMVVKSPYLRD